MKGQGLLTLIFLASLVFVFAADAENEDSLAMKYSEEAELAAENLEERNGMSVLEKLAREEECADKNEACRNPSRRCCKNRPCRCNIIGTICNCYVTVGEDLSNIFGRSDED